MSKHTYRGKKARGVGRQYNKQNKDFANNINGLNGNQDEGDDRDQKLDVMGRKSSEGQSQSANKTEKENRFSSKNHKRKAPNGQSHGQKSSKSQKPNNRRFEPSEKNAPVSKTGEHKRDHSKGFLEGKALRHKKREEAQKQNGQKRHNGKRSVNHPFLRRGNQNRPKPNIYGALDLGTNNCRLLLAKPQRRGFRVVDSFSRIIRLGEGLGNSDRLSDEAMDRTIEALKICSEKMAYRGVHKSRLIATEACRRADNGAEFIHRVHAETGLKLEIIEQKTEAQLAVSGCAALLDQHSNYALVFDIGGGSSELILVEISPSTSQFNANGGQIQRSPFHPNYRIIDWTSLPIGVVTLSEKFGGRDVTQNVMSEMIAHVDHLLTPFELKHNIAQKVQNEKIHLLGTSGTVTTVAGIHLKLEQYDRSKIDGFWLKSELSMGVTDQLIDMKFEGRAAHPCIGEERADLVLAGCAIFNAIYKKWPADRTRVADRGLREGILTSLMNKDLRKGTR